MTKERRLGRGLEALLGRAAAKPDEPGTTSDAGATERRTPPRAAQSFGGPEPERDGTLQESYEGLDLSAQLPDATAGLGAVPEAPPLRLPISRIDSNPFQPRQDVDDEDLQTLSDSLRAHGLLQPVVVRRVADRYQLIAGERRLRAAAKAGWNDVPVQVIEADDRQIAELAIVENLHRKDLNPLEKAASFQRYLQEYGSTQEELASRLKLDRSTISNLIRLLELPDAVQQALREGKITQGHARSLLPLGDEQEQTEFCKRIQTEGLSVRQTEAMVQELIDRADAEPLGLVKEDGSKSRPRRTASDHIAALEQELRAALGVRVKLVHNARGRGKLVIHFSSHEEFDRLREHICGPGLPGTQARAG